MHSMLGRYERVVKTILLGSTVNLGPLSTFSGSVILLPYATNSTVKMFYMQENKNINKKISFDLTVI